MTTVAPSLQKNLAYLKKSLGFKSARSFFHDYLQRRTRLDFNYSYYMKIEGGNIIPSPQVVSNICSALEKDAAEELMLAYCAMIFPEKASIFKKLSPLNTGATKLAISPAERVVSSKIKHLTPAQVGAISKSKIHYFSFLVLTLARTAVTLSQLEASLPPSGHNVDAILKDLEKMKLIHIENGKIRSISNDMKFPLPEGPTQKKLHEQIDLWNLTFYQEMNFESVLQKMLIRRVSSRYLSVIQAHCGVLLDLVRAADEMDATQNDDVLMLNISVQRGALPG
jgi:hypothetical protein